MPPLNNDTIQSWDTAIDWDEVTVSSTDRPIEALFGGGIVMGSTGTARDTLRSRTVEEQERVTLEASVQQLVRSRQRGTLDSPYSKVSKKDKTIKELDKISSSNKDLFNTIDKLNKDLSTLYLDSVEVLISKHGQLIAWAINNPNVIAKLPKNKIAKDIPYIMERYVIGNGTFKVDKDGFLENYLGLMIKFNNGKTEERMIDLVDDLYSLYIKEHNIRQELGKLKGNNKKESTVCEDYLYNTPHREGGLVFNRPF